MRRPGLVPALVLGAGMVLAATFTVPTSAEGAAPAVTPEPVSLTVELTRDISLAQSLPWVESFKDPSLTTVQRRAVSSAQGRDHVLAGDVDAAIIGTGYSAAERAEAKVAATIEVPIHVSTAMLFMSEPAPTDRGFEEAKFLTPQQNPICDPLGDTYDPMICEVRTRYTGPVRIPHANLAAMMLNVAADGLDAWQHPDVKAAMGVPHLLNPIATAVPTFIHREPGESVNFYLQKYITTVAPRVWELAKLANPGVPYEVDESISRPFITRATPTSQGQLVGVQPYRNAFTQGTEPTWASNMTDIPPAVSLEARETNPTTPYKVVQMKNGSDQWVAPTPDSISKAVAAGGTKPLFALDHKVDGAYPLVWVDNLSVAAKGLSPEKTNGVAGFVRYVATLGQQGAAALGEGKLSPALVTEALKGADAIVKSNCTGADVKVVSSTDPGPYAPPDLAKANIGTMSVCERVKPEAPAPAPSPAASPGTSSAVSQPAEAPSDFASDSGAPSQYEAALRSGRGAGVAAPPPALAPPPAAPQSKRPPAVKMPFAMLATSKRGVDRLATLLLGAMLFLLLRATVWPRVCKRLG